MIGRLFSGRARAEDREPTVPVGTRLYAVGDIHGRLDLLRALVDGICDDVVRDAAPRNVIVFLGDYVDRGADSRGVIDFLDTELPSPFEPVFLMGNHEDFMLRFLEDPSVGPSWLANGGTETLQSYGVEPGPAATFKDFARAQSDLVQALPRRHLAFLRGLRLMHEEGDYAFVHAGVKPGVPLAEQRPEHLLWIRSEFLDFEQGFGKIVVHGHTITQEPDIRRNRIGIDTGAYRSDRLTALVLEGTERAFLQT